MSSFQNDHHNLVAKRHNILNFAVWQDTPSSINIFVILHYMFISIFFLERQISQGQKLSTLTLQGFHRMMVCLHFYVSFTSLLGWKGFFWHFLSKLCFCLVGELHEVPWFFLINSERFPLYRKKGKTSLSLICLSCIYLTEQ